MAYTLKQLIDHDINGPIYQNIAVQDDKWVVTVNTRSDGTEEYDDSGELLFCQSTRASYDVIGMEKPEHNILLERGSNSTRSRGGRSWMRTARRALVNDRPFGVILYEEQDGMRAPGRYFISARQIHKGELGRGPQYARPKFAREAREPAVWRNEDLPHDTKPTKLRALRRHFACWARLTDVAKLMHGKPEEIVRDFYPFADNENLGLQVLIASSREEIHGQIIRPTAVQRFEECDLPRLFDRNPETIWVRKGFACAVLCLHHLGYTPEQVAKKA